ncbi:type VII secretion protein EccB [Micromonospora sp. NPDC092111]|uniref:type VII secretion protein EccB n=1 Tax=Micromonospora sp. NPDC092111 TaxID=3364289 RepID=UPI0038211434
MTTRRDQLQSYQFMTQRVMSAFVMRETDPQQSPLRRGVGALFGGLMVAVLVAAGVGIYGLLTKVGGDSWRKPGSVVVEKESGATYIYLDGRLHPTLNYTSALLAAGRPGTPVVRVSSSTLSSVPRGVTMGILNAPDSLPAANRRAGLPWTVCSAPTVDDTGRTINTVTLGLAAGPSGARGIGDDGLLVKDASLGMNYLVWHGRRHLVQGSRVVVPALFGAVTPAPVGTAWLNALPAGVDLAALPVPDRGDQSREVPGRRNGDVLVTQTASGPQHYLVLADGVAPITPVQQAIQVGQSGRQPAQVALSDVTSVPRSQQVPRPPDRGQPPATPPKLVSPEPGQQVCAATRDAGTPPELTVGGTLPGADRAAPTGSVSPDGIPLADRIAAPAGRVTVLKLIGSPGSYSIVTDLGIRYPVPSADALSLLGYPADRALAVPPSLTMLIPTGPTLDPRVAVRPAPVTAGG